MSNESIYSGQQLRRMRRWRELTQLDLASRVRIERKADWRL